MEDVSDLAPSNSECTVRLVMGFSRAAAVLLANTILPSLGVSELNFLACQLDANYWQLYLQTGSDTPSSGTCSNYQTIHLPCLC